MGRWSASYSYGARPWGVLHSMPADESKINDLRWTYAHGCRVGEAFGRKRGIVFGISIVFIAEAAGIGLYWLVRLL